MAIHWTEMKIELKQREVGEHFLDPCGNSVLVLSVLGMKNRGVDSRESCTGPSEELMGEHHVQAMLKQSGRRYRNRNAELLLPSCCVQDWLLVSLYRSMAVFPNGWTSFLDTVQTLYMLSVAFLMENMISGNKYIVSWDLYCYTHWFSSLFATADIFDIEKYETYHLLIKNYI